MAFSSVKGIMGGKPKRRRGSRVRGSKKRKRGATVKLKLKIKGSVPEVQSAIKKIAGASNGSSAGDGKGPKEE